MRVLRAKKRKEVRTVLMSVLMLYGVKVFATRGEVMPPVRSSESIRSVYISYNKPGGIYKKAHKACRKFFNKDMASKKGERVSYTVEIVTVIPNIRKASALCVAKRYRNDNVVAVTF